jgi:hypothetical protein
MHRVGDHVMPVRSCSSAFAKQPPGCNVAWSRPVASTVQFDTNRLPASARSRLAPAADDPRRREFCGRFPQIAGFRSTKDNSAIDYLGGIRPE